MPVTTEDLIPLPDACVEVRATRERLMRGIQLGTIIGMKVGARWFLPRAEVDRLRLERIERDRLERELRERAARTRAAS